MSERFSDVLSEFLYRARESVGADPDDTIVEIVLHPRAVKKLQYEFDTIALTVIDRGVLTGTTFMGVKLTERLP